MYFIIKTSGISLRMLIPKKLIITIKIYWLEISELKKYKKLIAKKYFWPTFCQDVKAYVRGCNIYLALKAISYKLYKNLQLLSIFTHC